MGANLKEVRERIKSVISTQQITKAMKMVSAAKLRRAQDAITRFRPYSERLNRMLMHIVSNMEGDSSTVFGEERDPKHVAIVIITSSRGLCGAFNTNVNKSAVENMEEKYGELLEQGKVTFVFIGKKGYDYIKRRYPECEMNTDFMDAFLDLTFEKMSNVARFLMDGFAEGTFDAVEVSYGRFKNAAVQFAETEPFLPVPKVEKFREERMRQDYIFEPKKDELLKELIPTILCSTLHRYALDTHASEHGARMTAMDKATENADELLRDLRINYNKARQEAITRELSEIVGGAAALEGG